MGSDHRRGRAETSSPPLLLSTRRETAAGRRTKARRGPGRATSEDQAGEAHGQDDERDEAAHRASNVPATGDLAGRSVAPRGSRASARDFGRSGAGTAVAMVGAMKRAFLVLWFLPLLGCDGFLDGAMGEGGNCPSALVARSYDLTVNCAGNVTHQGRVVFDGDVSVHLEGKAVSGDLDHFSFSMSRTCPGNETVPGGVYVDFLVHVDEQGHVAVVDYAASAADERAFCSFPSANQPEQTVTCSQGGSTSDALCQATLTRVP